MFLNFVVFAKTRVTKRFLAKNAGYSRGISQVTHLILVTLWCGLTDGRLRDHYLPQFLSLIGYQIAMVLRYKISIRTYTILIKKLRFEFEPYKGYKRMQL